jgi:L-fuculose-phosphate aldolase
MLETISEIFREAYSRGWVTTRDGNASVRYKEQNFFFVTPSGTRKQFLQPELYKKISTTANTWVELPYTDISAKLRPSGEIPMHWSLHRVIDTDVRVVLHLHPTYTTAAMYRGINLIELAKQFPELSRYTSVGPTVPVIPPITQELADACTENFGVDVNGSIKYNVIGMDRHGVIAVDTSPWRAFEHIERLEHICKIVLASGRNSSLMD